MEIVYEVGRNSLWLKFSGGNLRGMKFLCRKIRGLKFFGTKIKGMENLIDLKKYNPSGFPDLKKTHP